MYDKAAHLRIRAQFHSVNYNPNIDKCSMSLMYNLFLAYTLFRISIHTWPVFTFCSPGMLIGQYRSNVACSALGKLQSQPPTLPPETE